jgi:general secretion pathway protein A
MKLIYRSPRVEEPTAPPVSQPRIIIRSAERKDKPALMRVDLLDSYRNFYQFRETPFSVCPNPKMFYFSRSHAEALNHLRYGIYEGLGFTMITGEPGTGKTMLSRYFLSKAADDLLPVHISHPGLTQAELLLALLEALGQTRFAPGDLTERKLILRLEELLLSAQAQSRKVIIFLDEAQRLSFELLESLRLISNLETEDQKLLHIVLFGQTELEELLREERLRQMDQRILVRYRLEPLEFDEIQPYIQHQLLVARVNSSVEFTSEAASQIHRISCGLPRMVNALCERAMMSAFTGSGRKIDVRHVREGWESLSGIKIMGRTRLQVPV